jgi:tetratricopeptide (TPR) repeat protein
MPLPMKSRANVDISKLGKRLDSWKEIAAYLARGERTVKRWEAKRGLPAYRVPGKGKPSVYAYSRELDQWLHSTSSQELDAMAVEEEEAPSAVAWLNSISPGSAPLPEVRAGMSVQRKLGVAICAVALAAVAGLGFGASNFRNAHARFAEASPENTARNIRTISAARSSTPDVEKHLATDLYLKGRYEWNQRTPESLNRALDYFTQSIVRDPGYAPSYAGLADTYSLLREFSTMPESEAFPRAIAAARKAVELDEQLAEAHRALAFAEMYGNWNFAKADKEFHRAIELNPQDPVARKWYANAFAVAGQFEDSLAQINRAQELDPTSNSLLADKGLMLFNAGRRKEGIELLEQVERSAPQFRSPHFYLMLIHLYDRQYPAFLEEGLKAAETINDPVLKDVISAAQVGYAQRGEQGLLTGLYNKQMEYYRAGKMPGTLLAKTCIMMGKKKEALQLLEDAYARHELAVLMCLSNPDLLTLKDEARYKVLIKKIDFPAHVREQ